MGSRLCPERGDVGFSGVLQASRSVRDQDRRFIVSQKPPRATLRNPTCDTLKTGSVQGHVQPTEDTGTAASLPALYVPTTGMD